MHIPSILRRTEVLKGQRGAALVEYALLLAVIAIVCILAITTLGEQAEQEFTTVGASIAAAGN